MFAIVKFWYDMTDIILTGIGLCHQHREYVSTVQ